MITKHFIFLLAASAFALLACEAQPGRTDIASAPIGLGEITHEPMGAARIRAAGGQLIATNMRTTDDGVRSLYQPGLRWQARLDWADGTSAIRLSSINSRLSGEDQTSSLALDRGGGDAWRVTADFVSPVHSINVYDDGALAGTLRQQPNTPVDIIILPNWQWIIEFDVVSAGSGGGVPGTQQCSWVLTLPGEVVVRQGDTVLRGDRVEIIEDPHESYGGFDEIQVRGNGDVTYLSENVVIE